MNRFNFAFLVLLILVLAACSGKGQQAAVQPALQSPEHTTQAEAGVNPFTDPKVTHVKHIVVLKPGETQLVRDAIAGTLTKPTSHVFNTVFVGFSADISASELQVLTADGRIAYVEEDLPIELCRPVIENNPDEDPWAIPGNLTPTVGATITEGPIRFEGDNPVDWGVSRINAFPSPGLQGAGITVAIIDTGIDTDHPDLAGSLVAEYDAVGDVEGAGTAEDLHGHGTHVAGIVGARDNDIGTVGVAPECSFAAIKVFAGAGGSGTNSDLIRGIDWVAANQAVVVPPIRVANMSLSGTGTSRAMYDAIQACNDLGITTVVAAGNDFRDASQQMPASFDNVITVSAMRRVWNAGAYDYRFAMFSNWGNTVDLIAPGQQILSLRNDGTTRYMSGTSMACPHVAGMAALYLDENLADGFQETYDSLVGSGEAGTWTGDPDGVYEPLVDATEPGRGDWWMFGHDAQHTGQSPFIGAQTNNVKWTYTTGGPVRSSPAFGSDGTVYVGSFDNHLYAINPDGSLKWSYPTGNFVLSSPAIAADGTIYVGSADFDLYAINPDGTLLWSYTTGSYVYSSPAIGADGTIYVGSYDDHLYAINPDGTLLWSYTTGNYVYSSPAVGADGTVYIGSNDNEVYAINLDGSLKWSYTTSHWVSSSPAIAADGTVYVGNREFNLYAFHPDGSLKWLNPNWVGTYNSPAIGTDQTAYVGSGASNLIAFNPDGSQEWSSDTGSVLTHPAIGADGTVYVGCLDDKVYAINSDGSPKWSYTTGNHVYSSPAIGADGTVYVGSDDGKLYAFGT